MSSYGDSLLRAAVFLDRDGTVNEEIDYLYKIDDFRFIDGVPQAIAALNRAGFLVVLVTNQSGIARGYFSRTDVDVLHRHLLDQLDLSSAWLDGIYICPHHPDFSAEPCDCRKGEPGMLLRAARELNIDMSRSFMIGDKSVDLEAGRRGGCQPILVRTGYGRSTEVTWQSAVPVFDDLPAAVGDILEKAGTP